MRGPGKLGGAVLHAVATECISIFRHDVRNKLGAIRNATFYLKTRAKKTDLWTSDARVEKFFTLIEKELTQADSMMNDPWFLDNLFKPESASLTPGSVVQAALEGVPAEAATCDLACAQWEGDAEEWTLAVSCLIQNALESTEGSSQVRIVGRLEDGCYHLSIHSSGPLEVTAQDAQRPFRSTKNGHTGLGLNIATRIAARYDGGVSLTETDTGACATVRIPGAKATTGETE